MNWRGILETLGVVANYPLLSVKDTELTLASLAIAMGIVLVSIWISKIVQRIVGRGLAVRQIVDEGTVATTGRLTHYVILVVGTGIALETLGFDLTTLFAAGALLGVAVAFAMQNVLQNFVSGILLLLERTITPSDILLVEGQVVRVEEMRIRTTIVRTWDEEDLIIPNSTLVQSTVKNYTLRDSLFRLRCQVGVSYDSDLDRVAEVLFEVASKHEPRAKDRTPRVQLNEFGDSAILFEASIWIHNPWDARMIRSELNFAIWHALKANGIRIAYPQLDVHLDDLRPPTDASFDQSGEGSGPDAREDGGATAEGND